MTARVARLIDSSVWIEMLGGSRLADVCEAAVDGASEVFVPTVVLFEVYRKLQARLGEALALEGAALLRRQSILDLTAEVALYAADLSLARGLPMADSVVYAHARHVDAELVTMDNDFAALDGVKIIR